VREGWGAVRESLGRAVAGMAAAIPPLVVLGLMLRREVVTAVYHGGAYSAAAIHQTAGVFGMIVLSLPAQMLVVFLATLFVVRKDTIFPMKVAFANVVLNVVLNLALRPLFGAAGIALSTTLTVTLLAGVYAVAAQRRWHTFARAPLVAALVRAAASVLVVAGAAAALLAVLPEASTRGRALVTVAVVGATGLALHALVLLATRERSVATASRLLRLAGRVT
jgi:putative peptidoglycan lipid II flippase